MPNKIPCSVLVLTRNSAASLERCLAPLSRFAEIVVHDANSEDDSREIALRHGAKVYKQYDTDEKSVRVKNFTEMRLKQRAAASYDWVLYIDSDEEMTVELVEEVGVLLSTVKPKTIIQFPRLPIIDRRLRTHGIFFPEIVPRIHHRGSGATLQEGKVVHEKYVYDDTFTVITTKSHLRVPTDSVQDLRAKDDRYLLLEVERIREHGFRWSRYVRWILFREPVIILSLIARIVRNIPRYRDPSSVPFGHEWRYVRYHWRLFRAITGALFLRPLTAGKIR
ncbi:MAG: glycosyltransferase [Candidatus Peribacteraceae bacterium]